MEEEKKLYPFRFRAISDSYSWGEADCSLADLGFRDSVIRNGWLAGTSMSELMEMYMDRVTGDRIFSYFGRQFPLSVSLLNARERTPLMVHPGDELSADRYDSLGKTKFWYVLKAGAGARLYLGFASDTDASALYSACLQNTPDSLLNVVDVKEGDCFVIEPGTVHAAEGVSLLEISESSMLDFCLCGWGRDTGDQFDTSFDVAEALDFIDYRRYSPAVEKHPEERTGRKLAVRKEFTISRMDLPNTIRVHSDEATAFALYTCLEGELNVIVSDEADSGAEKQSYSLKAGDTILVPADVLDYMLEPVAAGTAVIESVIEPVPEADSYIDPTVKASLDGDETEGNIGDRLWRIR